MTDGDASGFFQLGAFLSIPMALLAAWAPNAESLIFARIAGGVAAGMLFPTTLSLVTALFRGAIRTKAIALWSGVGGGMAALGPIFGGILLEKFWWGSVFLIAVPLALADLILGSIVIPREAGENKLAVDHVGGVLSVLGVGALITGIEFVSRGVDLTLILVAAIAVVSLVLMYFRMRRAPNPLIDLKAASVPTFWVAAIAGTVAFGSLMATLFIGQQFTQDVMRYAPLSAALAGIPCGISLILAAPFAAKLTAQRGARISIIFGMSFMLLGFVIILALWHSGAWYLWIGLAYACVGFGASFASTGGTRALMESLPVSKGGMGSAFSDLTRDFGGAIMTAIMGTLLAVVYTNYFTNAFAHLPPAQAAYLGDSAAHAIGSSIASAEDVASRYPPDVASRITAAAEDAFTSGKGWAMLVAVGVTLGSIALVWWKYPSKLSEEEFFAKVALISEQEAKVAEGTG